MNAIHKKELQGFFLFFSDINFDVMLQLTLQEKESFLLSIDMMWTLFLTPIIFLFVLAVIYISKKSCRQEKQ